MPQQRYQQDDRNGTAKWSAIVWVFNVLLAILLGLLGYLLQQMQTTLFQVNENVIRLQTQQMIDRRDIDTNSRKIDENTKTLYELRRDTK